MGYGRYRNLCTKHHTLKYSMPYGSLRRKKKQKKIAIGKENGTCEKCGWDKSFCDYHRIKKGGEYNSKNVMVLCPNCHREIHDAAMRRSDWSKHN